MKPRKIKRRKPLLPSGSTAHNWRAHPHAKRTGARTCTRCARLWIGPDPPEYGCSGIRRGKPPNRISPRRADKRAKRGVRGALCDAALEEPNCHICGVGLPKRRIAGHHVKRVGPGWGDWVWAIEGRSEHPCNRCELASGVLFSNERAAAGLLRSIVHEWPTACRCRVVRRGNVAPLCCGLGSCHDRSHTDPAFEEEHDVVGIARRFGELHADL